MSRRMHNNLHMARFKSLHVEILSFKLKTSFNPQAHNNGWIFSTTFYACYSRDGACLTAAN